MNVGSSPQRTPGKHALLNKIVGREVGAARYAYPFSRYIAYDLCAGDGQENMHSGTSSPRILRRHLDYHRGQGGENELHLVEKDQATYQLLRLTTHEWTGTSVHCMDAREVRGVHLESDLVFVHNDPNSVHDFALSESFLRSTPYLTTTLSTLGCNVGGLKMLPYADRQMWYRHVETVLASMPPHHDGLLVRLDKDDAQWAYLLTGPASWRARYESDVENAFRDVWQKGLKSAWCSEGRGFDALVDVLFKTTKELKSAATLW